MKRLVVALSLLLPACTQPPPSATAIRLTSADSTAAFTQGGAIATAVAQGLAQRLQAQLKEKGAVGAVDFCSRTALVLTDSLIADKPGVSVKRTSTRIRNPRNEPDQLEQIALAWFDSARSAGGALPSAFIQAVGPDEMRFYRPLMIAPFCTQCHGSSEQLDPRVRQILEERYPNDRATGYQEGDLRGVIRVSLPRSNR